MSAARKLAVVAMMLAAFVGRSHADVWDVQTDNDNSAASTENEIVHGSDQLHDLAALPGPEQDNDWYRLEQKAYSSYEAVVDSTSGDVTSGLSLDRIASDGSTVVQSSAGVSGVAISRSLRWRNTGSTAVGNQYLRVRSGSCTTDCGPDDTYRIRFYDTTYAISRFNNGGTQTTIVIVQNRTDSPVSGTVYFWSFTGSLAGSSDFSLAARATLVLSSPSVPGVAGQNGAITIAHDGRYGSLSGKGVSVESSTGFAFDTPMEPAVY